MVHMGDRKYGIEEFTLLPMMRPICREQTQAERESVHTAEIKQVVSAVDLQEGRIRTRVANGARRTYLAREEIYFAEL